MPNELKLDNVEQALVNIANVLVQNARDNLQQAGHVASGSLLNSLQAGNPEVSDNGFNIDIHALDYFDYLNKGVRGTEGGTGLYAFKSNFPGRAMIASLMAGIGKAKNITVHSSTKHRISKNKTNNSAINQLSAAYGAAHNILKYGIAPTGFFDKAVESANSIAKEQLAAALKKDIINSLPDKI